MDTTYRLKQCANKGKQAAAIQTIMAYRVTAASIARYQWRRFYESAQPFNKQYDIKLLASAMSERFKQTCQYQVVGTLTSFISNRQNDFVYHVHRSSLDADSKRRLFIINKYGLWYNRYPFSMIFASRKEKKGKGKAKEYVYTIKQGPAVEVGDLNLSRKILNRILSKHRKPSFKRVNMNLDNKVAVISEKVAGKAKTFNLWVRLSTCEKGKPVYMPVQSNQYFDSIAGDRKNFCQVNLNDKNELSMSFIKDVPDQKESYIPETDKICVDIGLVTAMATDKGDLFGRDFMDRLLYYDNRITALAANRQRQGLPVRSARYARRVSELRDYLKNEINRLLNRIVEIYHPVEIVVEKLDFRTQQLSKRMNRLLSRFGKSCIVAKLAALQEEFGIITSYQNPAYTSQQCSVCGYVDKNNRKSQSVFQCKFCHSILHADVNAPRNLRKRSSQPTPFPLYMSKANILRELTGRFVDSLSETERKHHLRHSDAVSLLSANPYFAGTLAQLKGS